MISDSITKQSSAQMQIGMERKSPPGNLSLRLHMLVMWMAAVTFTSTLLISFTRGEMTARHLDDLTVPGASRGVEAFPTTTERPSRDKNVVQGVVFKNLPNSTKLSSLDTMAVGLIAFGKATNNRLVERVVRSIRAKGRWQGWVFVITDHPERFAPLEAADRHFVTIHPPAKDWEDRPENQYKHRAMKFKEFKTFLVEYLDLDDRLQHVEHILYMDIDVVVCNSIEEWVERKFRNFLPRTWTPESETSFMIMFQEAQRVCHGGLLLLSRGHSRWCLEEWRRHFHKLPHIRRDQNFIRSMYIAGVDKTHCRLACMERHRELVFPYARDLALSPPKNPNGEMRHRCKQFYHITNTHHAKQSNATVQQKFLEVVLELSPEERQSDDSLAHFQGTF